MAMHSAAILTRENKELRAANAKQKRKRERHRTYISQGEGLTIEEGMDRVRRGNEGKRGGIEQSEEQVQKRAARRCSKCNQVGHTARTCSQDIGSFS
ncbi:hypothetical protein ACJ73_08527 [Blastomyces percursus]|uniref:CCHC-type domain-containing protein n=1 Tax=Blastomyces percursus TaxID=1658174 RepID=A0A1J9QVA2_9EURO|nr:hypothetical protein ACJ73_08527 [Blastomyces percursus]